MVAVGDSKENPVRFRGAPVIPDDDKCEACASGRPNQIGVCPDCGEEWVRGWISIAKSWQPVLDYLKKKSLP